MLYGPDILGLGSYFELFQTFDGTEAGRQGSWFENNLSDVQQAASFLGLSDKQLRKPSVPLAAFWVVVRKLSIKASGVAGYGV